MLPTLTGLATKAEDAGGLVPWVRELCVAWMTERRRGARPTAGLWNISISFTRVVYSNGEFLSDADQQDAHQSAFGFLQQSCR
jgi:hypothetical protein